MPGQQPARITLVVSKPAQVPSKTLFISPGKGYGLYSESGPPIGTATVEQEHLHLEFLQRLSLRLCSHFSTGADRTSACASPFSFTSKGSRPPECRLRDGSPQAYGLIAQWTERRAGTKVRREDAGSTPAQPPSGLGTPVKTFLPQKSLPVERWQGRKVEIRLSR